MSELTSTDVDSVDQVDEAIAVHLEDGRTVVLSKATIEEAISNIPDLCDMRAK